MKPPSNFILLFGILFCTGITLLFDSFSIVPTVRQVWATRFPSTEGRVLSNAVTEVQISDGAPGYRVTIRYVFSVGGKEYTGNRYRYDTAATDLKWASEVVSARPPGTRVTVFYNPSDPQDSVLATGLEGRDLLHCGFMLPFNVLMVWLWGEGWIRSRRRPKKVKRPTSPVSS